MSKPSSHDAQIVAAAISAAAAIVAARIPLGAGALGREPQDRDIDLVADLSRHLLQKLESAGVVDRPKK